MMNWIAKTALKFLSYEALVGLIAQAIAYILEYARTHATEGGWDKAKAAVKQIKNWTTLLDEVYDDDTLTPEEEKKIEDAISGLTTTESIYTLITGKNKKGKKVKKVKKETKSVKKSSSKKTTKKA